MSYIGFMKMLEKKYKININKELQNALEEHFRVNLGIYTEQDLYEKSRKLVYNYKFHNLQ